MKIGISTACMYPIETEIALEAMIRADFDNFEIFINSDCELSSDYCNHIKILLRENQKNAVSLHPYTSELESTFFFSDYSRRFNDGIKYYQKYFEFAQRTGIKYVVIHGPKRFVPITYDELAKRLVKINKYAQEFGVSILLENVERCISRDPSLYNFLQTYYPEIGFLCDVKQVKRAGVDLYKMLKCMGVGLKHIHISDHSSSEECIPIGSGELDLKRLFEYLYSHSYNGTILLELYSNGEDQIKSLRQSINILRKNLRQIKI